MPGKHSCDICGEQFNNRTSKFRHMKKEHSTTAVMATNESSDEEILSTVVNQAVPSTLSSTIPSTLPPTIPQFTQPKVSTPVNKFRDNNFQQPATKVSVDVLADILFNSVVAMVEVNDDERNDQIIKSIIAGDDLFTENMSKLDKHFHQMCEEKKKEVKKFNETLEMMMGSGIREDDLNEVFNLLGNEKIPLSERQYQMKLCKLKAKIWEKDILQIGLEKTILVTEKIRSAMKDISEDETNDRYTNYLTVKKNQATLNRIKRRLWMKLHWIEILSAVILLFAVIVGAFIWTKNLLIAYFGACILIAVVIAYFFYF